MAARHGNDHPSAKSPSTRARAISASRDWKPRRIAARIWLCASDLALRLGVERALLRHRRIDRARRSHSGEPTSSTKDDAASHSRRARRSRSAGHTRPPRQALSSAVAGGESAPPRDERASPLGVADARLGRHAVVSVGAERAPASAKRECVRPSNTCANFRATVLRQLPAARDVVSAVRTFSIRRASSSKGVLVGSPKTASVSCCR